MSIGRRALLFFPIRIGRRLDGEPCPLCHEQTLHLLTRYPYPGNVRALKNLIERAAYRDTTNVITPDDLGMLPFDDTGTGGGSFQEKLDTVAKGLLAGALKQTGGNQKEAAKVLGLKYRQLRYYLKKYGVG